jgi:GDP-L-fucose synthase
MDTAVRSTFAGRRALVTGGTGMIGRAVVRILCEAGARVTSVSMDHVNVHPDATHLFGDLTDFAYCREITRGMDVVCHVAGVKGSVEVTRTKPASFFVPLLMMNTNVLEACRVNGVAKVVYTSTIGAYASAEILRESDECDDAPPMDGPPGWAKRMGELQIRAYRTQYGLDNFAIVRPTNVYGPGDNFDPGNAMVVPSLIQRVASGEDPLVVWGDGSAVRDFAYADDVAEGVVLALHHGTDGQPVNLGSGIECSVRELVETLRTVVPFNFRFDASKPSGVARRVMDIARARARIGYAPRTSLAEGLKRTWDWYIAHREESAAKHNYFRD